MSTEIRFEPEPWSPSTRIPTLDAEQEAVAAIAAAGLPGMERVGTANDQQLTVDATVGGVQFAAFPAGTRFVVFDVQDADIRVTFDGSDPTTSDAHIMNQGDSGIWSESLAADAKFIRDGSVDAIIHATPLK